MSEAIDLAIQSREDGLAVVRADTGELVLQQHAGAGQRPYIHPIQAPGGAGTATEDVPPHHPWQHGLYVGLNDVSGVGFWAEGLDPRRADTDGTFDSRLAGDASVEGGLARWTAATDYLDRDGIVMLDDRQQWSLSATDERLELDMTWTLHAYRDLTFGSYDYGGLFLRMPYRKEAGGRAFDSEEQSESGRRPRWVAVVLALPETEREVLAAMLDHPENPGSPVPWRIDNELGIGPSPSIAGAWTLADGAETTFRYRLALFAHPVPAETVEAAWARFAEEVR